MLGLRTQEKDKFKKFFREVNKQAKMQNSVFFLDCGEGHEFCNEEMDGEDLSGWLIPDEKINEFEQEFQNGKEISDKWNEFVAFAFWKFDDDDRLKITFKKY